MNQTLLQMFLKKLGVVVAPGTPIPVAASRALTKNDHGKTLVTGGAVTLTVAKDLPTGFTCKIINGAGIATIAPATDVTVGSVSSFTKTAGTNAMISLTQKAANAYVLTGEGAT